MLSMAFGQSKYYVDSLAENTKRGLRQKVRMGHCPSLAPVGYINDVRTKTIIVDKKRSKIIRQAFQKYVKGDMRLCDVADFLAHSGVTTRTGKRISKTKASFILSNPFYIGLFKYGGELHEGKHEPIIAFVREYEDKLTTISQKLDRLLNGYLDQVIDELDYRKQKVKLLSEKKTLQAEITSMTHTQNDWLAPFQNWLKDAQNLDEIASDCNLFAKKVAAKEIFGSHLHLGGRRVVVSPSVGGSTEPPTAWAALRAAHDKVGLEPESSILVRRRGLEHYMFSTGCRYFYS